MYQQIKKLADEAVALQNKDRMDAALREISALCIPTGYEMLCGRTDAFVVADADIRRGDAMVLSGYGEVKGAASSRAKKAVK